MNDSSVLVRLVLVMGVMELLGNQYQESTTEGGREAVPGEAAGPEREAAFHRLIDLHLDRCYRLATAITGDPTEAQDAVHDAFVIAWRAYGSLRDRERLEAWFDRIVVNTCRDRLRRANRWQIRDLSAGPDIAGGDTTAAVADEVVMRRALGRPDRGSGRAGLRQGSPIDRPRG